MPNGHAIVEQLRQEAERQRREFPDEQTGPHLFEPRPSPPSNGNGHTIRTAVIVWGILTCLAAAAGGTVAAASWVQRCVEDRVAPVERRLDQMDGTLLRMDDKLDRLVERELNR